MQFAPLAVKHMIFRLFSAIFAEMLDNIYIYIYMIDCMKPLYSSVVHTFFIIRRRIMRIILDTDKKTITVP